MKKEGKFNRDVGEWPEQFGSVRFLVLNDWDKLTSLFSFVGEVSDPAEHVVPWGYTNINGCIFDQTPFCMKPTTSFPSLKLVSKPAYFLPEQAGFWWDRERCSLIYSGISLLSASEMGLSVFHLLTSSQREWDIVSLGSISSTLAAKNNERRHSLSIYLTSATFKIFHLRGCDWKHTPVL